MVRRGYRLIRTVLSSPGPEVEADERIRCIRVPDGSHLSVALIFRDRGGLDVDARAYDDGSDRLGPVMRLSDCFVGEHVFGDYGEEIPDGRRTWIRLEILE